MIRVRFFGPGEVNQKEVGPARYHRGRNGIEFMINSFGDGSCSWVMIVNGKTKYVTEMSEGTPENHIDDIGDSTGKPV